MTALDPSPTKFSRVRPLANFEERSEPERTPLPAVTTLRTEDQPDAQTTRGGLGEESVEAVRAMLMTCVKSDGLRVRYRWQSCSSA